jgi:hypothetical protein
LARTDRCQIFHSMVSRAGLAQRQGIENRQVIDSTIRRVSTIRSVRGFIVQKPVQVPFRSSSIGPTCRVTLTRAIPNTVRRAEVRKVNNDTIRFRIEEKLR